VDGIHRQEINAIDLCLVAYQTGWTSSRVQLDGTIHNTFYRHAAQQNRPSVHSLVGDEYGLRV